MEKEPNGNNKQHVADWKTASETRDIFSHIDRDGLYNYVSQRDILIQSWLDKKWRITLGAQTFEGTLALVENTVYGMEDYVAPAFTLEVDTGGDFPLEIRGIFTLFEPVLH